MTTITLTIPDDLARRLRERAEETGQGLNDFVVDALEDAAFDSEDAVLPEKAASPLRPFTDYPSEAAYVAAAVQGAQAMGLDPEAVAGIAAGIADAEMGRTISLEEYRAKSDKEREERRRQQAAA